MRVVKLLLLVLLVAAAGLGYVVFRGLREARTPYKGYAEPEIFFTVARGASGTEVARKLEQDGIISDQRLFVAALRLRGEREHIQAGEYRFAEPLSTVAVLDRLIAGDVYTFAVTVPEGLTLVETAEHLEALGLGDRSVFVTLFEDAESVADLDPNAWNLEGYLFPTTYRFTRSVTPQEVTRTMVSQFRSVFDEARRVRAAEVGLTVREIVTLASIIEKETGSAPERPLIGSVFWNRLNRGMPLGSDPTIIYALKLDNRYDGNLRRADLEMDSPYNSYRVAGLPPGPIASPGEAAIDAALEPEESDYLYFVSKNDGTHHFSRTYREHQRAVREYQIEYFRRRRNGTGSGSGRGGGSGAGS